MEFKGIKDIAIYGTDCVVDISRGDGDCAEFISAREKYFDVAFDDGTLTVRQKSRNIFYRIILHKIEFKLILPRNFRGKLRFRNKNGGLYVSGCDFTEMELSTSNGKFEISSTACNHCRLKMQNGTVMFKNVSIADTVSIKCANGDIKAESVRASEFTLSSTNASLTAIDVTAKKFECTTSNGAIDASGITADDLKLETSNGKICAAPLGERDDYRLSAETAHGALIVDGVAYKKLSDVAHLQKRLSAKTSNGDIDIRFLRQSSRSE